MSAHNVIVVSEDPKGHFGEAPMVSAAGTFKPGQLVEIDKTASLVDGRPQYKKWASAAEIIVVREFDTMGMLPHTGSYAAGQRFLFYTPLAGDEVQVLTNDTEVELGASMAAAPGGTVREATAAGGQFVALEALATVSDALGAAGRLLLCRRTSSVTGTPETTTAAP